MPRLMGTRRISYQESRGKREAHDKKQSEIEHSSPFWCHSSLSIFLTAPPEIIPQLKASTLNFLINKLVIVTPQTNNTWKS